MTGITTKKNTSKGIPKKATKTVIEEILSPFAVIGRGEEVA
jgi:hypothetical protein